VKLVVACDGTWNVPESQTHIHKICRAGTALSEMGSDISVKYLKGVGTEAGHRFSGGALGKGLSDNVRAGYEWLARNYSSGDEIYIFGFSRGAYTARSLAGFLNFANLLEIPDLDQLEEAYSAYRFRDHHERAAAFRDGDAYARSRKGVKVHFLGVFDTVGALGVPSNLVTEITRELPHLNVNFHDVTICGNVEYACHALAIDEQRGPFRPTWWEKPDPRANITLPKHIRQAWFPGVHSDIGGGYDDDDGFANLSLDWMIGEAKLAGLDLRPGFEAAKMDITPNPSGTMHDSMGIKTWIMHLHPSIDRFIRPIGEAQRHACTDLNPYVDVIDEYVHWSVIERMEKSGYRPRTLVKDNQFALPDGVQVLDDRQ
jgi:uncharacterized protein (DUF2235 family)